MILPDFERLAYDRTAAVPKNQRMIQAYENMGLNSTQIYATLVGGVSGHSPEGIGFKRRAEEIGFRQAVTERDGGEPIAPGVSRDPYQF